MNIVHLVRWEIDLNIRKMDGAGMSMVWQFRWEKRMEKLAALTN